MNKDKHSKKYWIVLVCWFFSPLFIRRIFHNQVVSENVIFVLIAIYWIFVLATFAYENHLVTSYLKVHYLHEFKKRETCFLIGRGGVDLSFIFSFSPENDDKWKNIQSNFRNYLLFLFISFGFVPLYVVLHLILKI